MRWCRRWCGTPPPAPSSPREVHLCRRLAAPEEKSLHARAAPAAAYSYVPWEPPPAPFLGRLTEMEHSGRQQSNQTTKEEPRAPRRARLLWGAAALGVVAAPLYLSVRLPCEGCKPARSHKDGKRLQWSWQWCNTLWSFTRWLARVQATWPPAEPGVQAPLGLMRVGLGAAGLGPPSRRVPAQDPHLRRRPPATKPQPDLKRLKGAFIETDQITSYKVQHIAREAH